MKRRTPTGLKSRVSLTPGESDADRPSLSGPATEILGNGAPARVMHTVSLTEGLAQRKAELVRLPNRRDHIHQSVLAKTRLGLSYDEAWEHVKREHAGWFLEGTP
jgi:hypothetical protein